MEKREYRVRPVVRYVVTEYVTEVSDDSRLGQSASSGVISEHDNIAYANAVAEAMASRHTGATAHALQHRCRPAAELDSSLSDLGVYIEGVFR